MHKTVHCKPCRSLQWIICDIDGLVLDCSNSSALAMEFLQSCTKPSIYDIENEYKCNMEKPSEWWYSTA